MLSKIFIAENFLKQEYDFTLHPSSPFVSGSAFIPLYYKKKQ